jgi:large subunit ribosomal protein L9
MKVILNRDIPKKGKSGDVINVADGYARNYLFPREYAVPAAGRYLKEHQVRQEREQTRSAGLLQQAKADSAKIAGKVLTFIANVGTSNRLYGSITAQDIADKIKADSGVEVDKRRIGLADPIKLTGEYHVPVRLHNDVSLTLHVMVDTEAGIERRKEQAAAAARAEADRAAAEAAAAAERAASEETTAEADTGPSADGAEEQSAGQ